MSTIRALKHIERLSKNKILTNQILLPAVFNANHQIKNVSTVQNASESNTVFKRILQKIPFINVNKSKMMASGYIQYEGIVDYLKVADFFDDLNLPDTFYSWFVVIELHVWMLAVRAMAEGDDGRIVRNTLLEALWADVGQRVKKLGATNPAATRAQVGELAEQLQAALIAYDEGLQGDDCVLAGALWRRFYQHGEVDPKVLDDLVRYVRRQIKILESLSREEFTTKQIRWSTNIRA